MRASFSNAKHFNIAADCEVNSYIENLPPDAITADKYDLPPCCGTKFYYENIKEDDPDPGNHQWEGAEGLTDAEKQLVQNQIDHIAKEVAKQVEKQHGHFPSELSEYIKGLFKQKQKVFDWKSYFRRMIGVIQSIELKKTRKKESIRFPDASGIKHKRKVNIAIVVDTSGSVSDEDLCDFFSEINHVYKAGGNITVIENDAAIQRVYPYNGNFSGKITGRGGKTVPLSIVIY